ncbi:hypothetical protein [Streptomyces sp. NPDC001292]|uniref:hypothetical protein n=1 Tax=Streptomyces sp. NPDC001292 TaxID=3364558 RepID=UPI0036ADCE46
MSSDRLSRTDAVLHDAAVTDDPDVSDDAMRSVPLSLRSNLSECTKRFMITESRRHRHGN